MIRRSKHAWEVHPPANPLALRARYIFSVDRPPIADGYLLILGQRVLSVDSERPDCQVRDLGDVAILPGLVNAHTHLEFSDLRQPIGRPGMSLVDWIGQVIAQRRAASNAGSSAVLSGLAESLAAGTTTLGEIATSDWRPYAAAATAPLPGVMMFHEAIAPTHQRVAETIARLEQFMQAKDRGDEILAAISPHAPYTVHPELLAALVDMSRRYDTPLAMHLAESREELELLATQRGPFRDMLAAVGAWQENPGARLAHVGAYLEQLAAAPRALVIHGNYLTDEELDFLAEHRQTMSVVYCPRTHQFFAHQPYPLERMLQRGIAVALGTDSRASNPDLSLFEEMRFVARHYPRIPPATVLSLATQGGAHALGLANEVGTLAPGKLANLAIVPASGHAADPHELLFNSTARIEQVWLHGRPVADAAE